MLEMLMSYGQGRLTCLGGELEDGTSISLETGISYIAPLLRGKIKLQDCYILDTEQNVLC